MKKLLITLLLLFSLIGCGQKAKYIEIETYPVDMSLYRNMTSTGHHFIGASVEEINRVFDEEGSGVFYIGNSFCPTCNKMVYIMEEAAKANDTTIYYLDTIASGYTLEDPPIVELIGNLSDVLLTDERGFKTLNTPHVFVLKNGEIVGSEIGKIEAGNEDFVEHATKVYSQIFKKLK